MAVASHWESRPCAKKRPSPGRAEKGQYIGKELRPSRPLQAKKASLPRMTGEGTRTFGKDGGDLLSRLRSTIGAVGLNFSVRNGKRWNTNAIATRMGDMTDNPDASEDPHREGIGHVSRYAPSQTPRRGRKGGNKPAGPQQGGVHLPAGTPRRRACKFRAISKARL